MGNTNCQTETKNCYHFCIACIHVSHVTCKCIVYNTIALCINVGCHYWLARHDNIIFFKVNVIIFITKVSPHHMLPKRQFRVILLSASHLFPYIRWMSHNTQTRLELYTLHNCPHVSEGLYIFYEYFKRITVINRTL